MKHINESKMEKKLKLFLQTLAKLLTELIMEFCYENSFQQESGVKFQN